MSVCKKCSKSLFSVFSIHSVSDDVTTKDNLPMKLSKDSGL